MFFFKFYDHNRKEFFEKKRIPFFSDTPNKWFMMILKDCDMKTTSIWPQHLIVQFVFVNIMPQLIMWFSNLVPYMHKSCCSSTRNNYEYKIKWTEIMIDWNQFKKSNEKMLCAFVMWEEYSCFFYLWFR